MTLAQKEAAAISVLKAFEPKNGEDYFLCYSGGKDSDVIRILAQLAGVKHTVEHNLTTVDSPETVRYVRDIGAHINIPQLSMWQLIEKKGMPPTRIARYCCSELKEKGGKGRLKITGVRKAESIRRARNGGLIKIIGAPKATQKFADNIGADVTISPLGGIVMNNDNDENRRLVEHCYRTTSTMINPIVDWTDGDVWDFLRHYGCEGNPLYKCGEKRVGCIGCPLAGYKQMKSDFKKYPIYRLNYIKAFERMLKRSAERGRSVNAAWRDGEAVMRWWVGDDPLQITFDDYEKMIEEMDSDGDSKAAYGIDHLAEQLPDKVWIE